MMNDLQSFLCRDVLHLVGASKWGFCRVFRVESNVPDDPGELDVFRPLEMRSGLGTAAEALVLPEQAEDCIGVRSTLCVALVPTALRTDPGCDIPRGRTRGVRYCLLVL